MHVLPAAPVAADHVPQDAAALDVMLAVVSIVVVARVRVLVIVIVIAEKDAYRAMVIALDAQVGALAAAKDLHPDRFQQHAVDVVLNVKQTVLVMLHQHAVIVLHHVQIIVKARVIIHAMIRALVVALDSVSMDVLDPKLVDVVLVK